MNNMFKCLILIATCLIMPAVYADQTDPELEQLFSELGSSDNGYEADVIADRIWTIWLQSSDQSTNELMEQAMTEVGRGNLAEGRDIFIQVTKRSPDFAEGWNKLATVNYMMGDIEESLINIEETLKREPRHFGSISGRGLCYIKLSRWQSALIEFKAALDIHPWLLDAKRNLKILEENLKNQAI